MRNGFERRFLRFVGVKKPDESSWKYPRWNSGAVKYDKGQTHTIYRRKYTSGIELDPDAEKIRFEEFNKAVLPFTDGGQFSREAFDMASDDEKVKIVTEMLSVRDAFFYGSLPQSQLATHFQNEIEVRTQILYSFNGISWAFLATIRRHRPVKRFNAKNALPKI